MVLTGSCPWPGPWFRTYGAHLHLQAREDPHPTAVAGPSALSMDIVSEKKTLRQSAREKRANLARACPNFAQRIACINELPVSPGAMVSGYIAMGDEADASQLIAALQARGCEIAYPLVHK